MTNYYLEGNIASGQTATILTQDGRFGTLDLVQYVLTAADPDVDNPSDAVLRQADRMASTPQNRQYYLPFDRSFAESTARLKEAIHMQGTPQPFIILSADNAKKAAAVRKEIFALALWWRTEGQTPGLLHIAEGLDNRFASGILTFSAYQAQWREITKANGKTPRNVTHQLSEQKKLWTALIKQMRDDPTNEVRQLILHTPGTAMQVANPISDDHFLDNDPALYNSPTMRHQQFLKWLTLGSE